MYLLIKVRGKFNISVSADRQHVEESFGLRRASTMFNFDLMIDATLTASQATAIQFSQREFSNLPKHKTTKTEQHRNIIGVGKTFLALRRETKKHKEK